MQEQMSDIEWEIRQLWMAIDYYERAIESAYFRADVEKFSETSGASPCFFLSCLLCIASLNNQVKELERKRDFLADETDF